MLPYVGIVLIIRYFDCFRVVASVVVAFVFGLSLFLIVETFGGWVF